MKLVLFNMIMFQFLYYCVFTETTTKQPQEIKPISMNSTLKEEALNLIHNKTLLTGIHSLMFLTVSASDFLKHTTNLRSSQNLCPSTHFCCALYRKHISRSLWSVFLLILTISFKLAISSGSLINCLIVHNRLFIYCHLMYCSFSI